MRIQSIPWQIVYMYTLNNNYSLGNKSFHNILRAITYFWKSHFLHALQYKTVISVRRTVNKADLCMMVLRVMNILLFFYCWRALIVKKTVCRRCCGGSCRSRTTRRRPQTGCPSSTSSFSLVRGRPGGGSGSTILPLRIFWFGSVKRNSMFRIIRSTFWNPCVKPRFC